MSQFYALFTEYFKELSPYLLVLLVVISILHRLLSNIPIWDMILNKSKRRTQILNDSVSAFKIIKNNVEDETLLPILKKELESQLLMRYLNIRIKTKKFQTLLSIYSNSEKLKKKFDSKTFFHYSDSFKDEKAPYFSTLINSVTIWIYSILIFLMAILFLSINPILSDATPQHTLDYILPAFDETPLTLKEAWYTLFIIVGITTCYYAIKTSLKDIKVKKKLNMILNSDKD